MAGLAASPARNGEESAKIEVLKNVLYDEMQQHGSSERLYNQKDIIDLNIIPNDDIALLLRVVQGLCDDYLLVSTNDGRSGLAWRWRSREDAQKYRSLPNNETVMVYALIDEAGSDGIWSRTLKAKLKMHESVLKQCVKHLETKGYITDMKSVEHPNKKMYIRADLRPSDRATGGPWYTDSNLDEAFISELEAVVYKFIMMKSAYYKEGTRAPKKGVVRGDTAAAKGKKRAASEMTEGDGTRAESANPPTSRQQQQQQHSKKASFLPYPAGYARYPTIHEIARFIADSGITNNTTLSESDVQQLVDVLVFDGLVEPTPRIGRRRGYRATRIARQDPSLSVLAPDAVDGDGSGGGGPAVLGAEPPTNGLMEAPCGKCPVFELCEEGGPVSPSNCVYFQKWLGLDD
ncbi:hypothetical protein VTK73DRAFT_3901 [Phialemonium thermophilum]|uniref:DNA-directed RNA polymerase III subunit RPC6 n=1 Tax=Phialemonium thermophilum TaxID=223376 RepID=A0ABR3WW79_9PEZI